MSDAVSAVASADSVPQMLPRVLGLWDGVGMVVGSIIGSGIFLKVSQVDTALMAFGFGPIIGIWIVVGLVSLFGSLALAELAAMFPHAGGPYLYMREAYGKLPAFLWGWTEFWVVRPCSVGALSCATAIYLNQIVPLSHVGQECVAIGIVVGLTIANIFSTRWSASLMNLFTAIKVLFLAGLIVLPTAMGHADASHWEPVWQSGSSEDNLWTALGLALMAVMWPYHGWINLAPVAEDIREPQRNIPKALGVGLTVIILVYVGANLSYHLVLTMGQVAESQAIASDVCRVIFGPFGAKVAAAGVLCSTFGAANSSMLCGPRVLLAMARDDLMPRPLKHLHNEWRTPANALITQSVWAVLLIALFYAWNKNPKAAFDGLTDSVILAALIFDGLTVAAVYVLRVRRPQVERPYRTWGYPFTPGLLLGIYAFAFVMKLIDEWHETATVIGLIAAGVVYYAWVARRQRPVESGVQ
jgi:APA family basic amino acid/polyamine antiporter